MSASIILSVRHILIKSHHFQSAGKSDWCADDTFSPDPSPGIGWRMLPYGKFYKTFSVRPVRYSRFYFLALVIHEHTSSIGMCRKYINFINLWNLAWVYIFIFIDMEFPKKYQFFGSFVVSAFKKFIEKNTSRRKQVKNCHIVPFKSLPKLN